MRHNVNDKVIALTNPQDALTNQPRVKGNIYIVMALRYCTNCGQQCVNVSGSIPPISHIGTRYANYTLCDCGGSTPHDGLWWTNSFHFAPINEETLKEAEKNEEYELCAQILDALQPIIVPK